MANLKLPSAVEIDPEIILYRIIRDEQPISPVFDYNIATTKINIRDLRIEILKNNNGVRIASIMLSKVLMKKLSKNGNDSLGLKGTLHINYFNKRKMEYEPFLEPW